MKTTSSIFFLLICSVILIIRKNNAADLASPDELSSQQYENQVSLEWSRDRLKNLRANLEKIQDYSDISELTSDFLYEYKQILDGISDVMERHFPKNYGQRVAGNTTKHPRFEKEMDFMLVQKSRRELHTFYKEFQAVLKHIDNIKTELKNIYKLPEFKKTVKDLYNVVDEGLKTVVREMSKPDKYRREEAENNWM